MMAATRCSLPFRPGLSFLLLAACLVSPAGPARAADARPGNRLEFGVEERIRTENWDNLSDFDRRTVDARHQVRYRTRAWEKLNVGPKLEFLLQLDNETFHRTTPATRFVWDETIVENLYLDCRMNDRLSARLGRQNLTRGDGFLLADGGPLDGSRAAYLNALDVSCAIGKSKLELIAISDPERDIYVPPIHDRRKPLIEWDDRALGLYLTDAALPRTDLEAYYFFKTETGDTRPATNPAAQRDRRVHTLGGRLTRQFDRGWSVSAEVAGQAGRQNPSVELLAWGTWASVRKVLSTPMKPSLALGYVGLSGDDRETERIEGWDPLFSRWPKWSELYIYTQATEKGPAYWTNLTAPQVEFQIAPVPPLNLRATYYRLGAFHPFPGSQAVYAAGKKRGDLYQVRADVKLNDSWRGHVVGEWLQPGDFYARPDAAWFFRAEVIYSIRRTLGL